jgi:hypothetical protein
MKTYAIIQPAATYQYEVNLSSIQNNLYSLFAQMQHRFEYEHVCGYSLGHSLKFYDSLQSAVDQVKSQQYAVIEIELDTLDNVCVNRITSYSKMSSSWLTRDVASHEVSPGALNEIARQFAENRQTNHQEPDNAKYSAVYADMYTSSNGTTTAVRFFDNNAQGQSTNYSQPIMTRPNDFTIQYTMQNQQQGKPVVLLERKI